MVKLQKIIVFSDFIFAFRHRWQYDTAGDLQTNLKERVLLMHEKSLTSAFGSTVQDYYLAKARALSAERKERLSRIGTRKEAEEYIAEVREKIRNTFAPPNEKTPLNPIVTKTSDRGNIRIECIVYESRPGYPVTANLYLPKTGGKHPAVLFLCGHSQEGKKADPYQFCGRHLAEMGYAVLIPDPVAQGERYQFLDASDRDGIDGACCNEHNMLGKQLLLTGEYFGTWRAWDAIRGLDYLLSRPEVDSSRVGITGNSGGGTMTTFVNALDDRFTMAAPGCYITTWRNNLENELPIDVEQVPPGLFGAGCEMADFLIAAAPRPIQILSQRNDFFDPRGAEEAFEDVRRIYRLLGAEDKARLFIGPDSHGYTKPNRETMYAFFNEQSGIQASAKEPDLVPLDRELDCTPSGQIAGTPGTRRMHDLILDRLEDCKANRKSHTAEELRTYFRKELGIPEKTAVPYYRVLRPQETEECCYARFFLETEKNTGVVLKLASKDTLFSFPETKTARLFVPHLDSVQEHAELPPADGADFLLDPHGIGESQPSGCDQYGRDEFFKPYLFDYHYASSAMLLGESYPGLKVRDILSAWTLLKSKGYEEIVLCGNGQGGIPLRIAALFTGGRVQLYGAADSWESMVKARVTLWPQSCMIPGVLRITDLPEIDRLLGDRLEIRSRWDAMFRVC